MGLFSKGDKKPPGFEWEMVDKTPLGKLYRARVPGVRFVMVQDTSVRSPNLVLGRPWRPAASPAGKRLCGPLAVGLRGFPGCRHHGPSRLVSRPLGTSESVS